MNMDHSPKTARDFIFRNIPGASAEDDRPSFVTAPQWGFTLPETLMTLAIAGLLLGLAAPALRSLSLNNRMTAAVNQLMGELNLARSESIKRNAVVAICKSSNGTTCYDEAAWHKGWIVFTDNNNNHAVDAGETVIHVQQALEGNLTLRYGETGKYSYVRYNPTGEAWPGATFTFCDGRGADSAKAVIVYWTGRPRVSTKTSDGKALNCT